MREMEILEANRFLVFLDPGQFFRARVSGRILLARLIYLQISSGFSSPCLRASVVDLVLPFKGLFVKAH